MTYITAFCSKCGYEKEVISIYIGKDGYFNIRLKCKHSILYKFHKRDKEAS